MFLKLQGRVPYRLVDIETFVQYAHDQDSIDRVPKLDELFTPI